MARVQLPLPVSYFQHNLVMKDRRPSADRVSQESFRIETPCDDAAHACSRFRMRRFFNGVEHAIISGGQGVMLTTCVVQSSKGNTTELRRQNSEDQKNIDC
jgi:hypothetical protein